MIKKNQKKIIIIFMNDFNNQIKIYVNGNLKFNAKVITDNVSGKSDKTFIYDYSKDSDVPFIKVESKEGNCFDIKTKKDFKLVYLFYDSTKIWTLRFSNKYYVDN